jgi:hypothetical protein
VLRLPRSEQPAAIRAALADAPPLQEAWNSAFGEGSLFSAFTRTSVARGVHAANRAALSTIVRRPGFRIIEVGGGAGVLWQGLLDESSRGEILVVDPHPDGSDGVRAAAPAGVEVRHLVRGIEEADLPAADVIVLSLTLHHVAGADAVERARVGLAGSGKLEALRAARASIGTTGLLLLNEADVHCDLELAPGDPLLAERLTDSYVRRFACSILEDIALGGPDAPRWEAIVWRWGLGQVPAATHATYAERDVYELDVPRWLALLDRAGLRVERRGFTDRWLLFHQYVVRG